MLDQCAGLDDGQLVAILEEAHAVTAGIHSTLSLFYKLISSYLQSRCFTLHVNHVTSQTLILRGSRAADAPRVASTATHPI